MASAGEATMFWGVRVEEKSVVREPLNDDQEGSDEEESIPIAEEEYVHITQVALEPGSGRGKRTTLYMEVAGTKFALGTLEEGRCEQFPLDVVVDETFELSHTGKGVISVTGYRTLLRDMSLFSDDYDSEDESEESEEEGEEGPKAADNKGDESGESEEECEEESEEEEEAESEEEEEEESEEEEEPPVTGRSKEGKKFEKEMLAKAQKKLAKEGKAKEEEYNSDSEEEEESEEDAGVEGKDFSDMDTSEEGSGEDSEEEEEEPPKKTPSKPAGKRSAPETSQPSAKKAKGAVDTPVKTPSKGPGKTPANTPAKSPAVSGSTPGKSPKSVSASLKSSIEKTLKSKGKPIDMSAFNKEYEQAVGKKLDYKVEGFRKLRDLIESIPDVASIRDEGGRLCVASP